MNPELNSIEILNGRFAPVTLEETVDLVSRRIQAGERGYLCTVNVAILMMMRQDPRLQRFVDNASGQRARASASTCSGGRRTWSRRWRRDSPRNFQG